MTFYNNKIKSFKSPIRPASHIYKWQNTLLILFICMLLSATAGVAFETDLSGQVSIWGDTVRQEDKWYPAAGIRYIPQFNIKQQVYTVFENVEFPLLLFGMDKSQRKEAVLQALAWVGLLDKITSKPAQLSGGECQRVAVARAMVKKPDLILADEPTANLDAANSHNILRTMARLNKELNATFIFATHDDKVIQYLERIITLNDGKVVKDAYNHQPGI